MFSYKTPNFIKRIDIKKLSIFFTAIYVLSLIPMLILCFYDWPSADDFSMALQTHQAFTESGNVFAALWASLKKSWFVYSRYEGYFFSIILTDICPGAFSEKIYFITPFIILGMLTFGVRYFFDALFVRVWKLDKHLTNIAAMATLFLMVQCMPKGGIRVEAFYWYSGAINYTFTFGMAFFWLGLVLRSVYDEDEKARKRKLIWAAFWGFWMGGANYLTALELAICSVLMLIIFFMVKKGRFKLLGVDPGQERSFGYIWIPALTNLIGFGCSCFTPGNLVRSAETQHIGAVKSILLSMYSTLDMMINDMARWEFYVILVLLIPIFYKLSEKMKQELQHPILFALFAFLLVSSNMTPAFFAVGNVEAGRLRALAWMEFSFLMVLTVFYFTAWLGQNIRRSISGKCDSFSYTSSVLIVLCTVFLFAGALLSSIPDHGYFSGGSALSDIMDGSADTFRRENLERYGILKDDSVKDAELKEHTSQPEMLFFYDITPDKDEWVNGAVATYYEKDSVVMINN